MKYERKYVETDKQLECDYDTEIEQVSFAT
jgi:hypothetical protein